MDVHLTDVVLLQSQIFMLQPPKPPLAVPPATASRGQLCCRVGLTGPPYSHRRPGHSSTHQHLLLFSGDDSLTQHGHPLLCLRRLRVVPFLGLAIVHRVGSLGAAWSTLSTNDSHRKRHERGVGDSRDPHGPWPHASRSLHIM